MRRGARGRIVVLWHRRHPRWRVKWYLVTEMADIWREQGFEVLNVFGTGRFVPADLILVHVDLSLVPDEYLEFAARYPVAINGHVKDLRKSSYSSSLVAVDDAYDGPVIVKSDLNYGGRPERALRFLFAPQRMLDYPIYPRRADVPAQLLRRHDVVVQKFLPEMHAGQYCIRQLSFLGDGYTSVQLLSPNPVVRWVGSEIIDVEPTPEAFVERERLGIDFGNLDYVVRDGQTIVFDANKTRGTTPPPLTQLQLDHRQAWASGIYSYLR